MRSSLLLASVFVVVSPDLALNVVAVVLGAYGLFFAMSELLFLIAPPPRGRARSASKAGPTARRDCRRRSPRCPACAR